jgi:hypothetical protein
VPLRTSAVMHEGHQANDPRGKDQAAEPPDCWLALGLYAFPQLANFENQGLALAILLLHLTQLVAAIGRNPAALHLHHLRAEFDLRHPVQLRSLLWRASWRCAASDR